MQTEPDVSGDATDTVEPPLEIEAAWGSEHEGPFLPETIDVTPVDQYVNATSVALQSESLPAEAFDTVTVHGIVRGQSQSVSLEDEGTVHETNLNLTVLEADSSGVVVEAAVEVFAAMYIREADGAQIPKATLFQAYSRWTDKHDIDGTNASWFGRKLSNVVDYEDNRARAGDDLITVYTGIDLTNDGSELLE